MPTPNPLQRLRTQLGLSQAAVAEMVGVSQPNYHRWESGAARIPEDKIKKLAKALKSTADVLRGASRYAAAPLSFLSDEDGYWGEAVLHFASGSEPVVVSISERERERLEADLQSEERGFVEVVGLCNEYYLVRRDAISECYLSDEAADCYGAPDVSYSNFLPIQLVDDRLWDVLSRFAADDDSIAELPMDEIVEALSYFMTPTEIADYVSSLEGDAPEGSLGVDGLLADVLKERQLQEVGGTHNDPEKIEFRRDYLLSRATESVLRLSGGAERHFPLIQDSDLVDCHVALTSLDTRQNPMIALGAGEGQTGFFRAGSIEFVRLPKHLLDRALNGDEIMLNSARADG